MNMPMNMEVASDVAKFAVTMLSVINPLGALPLFITLTQSFNDQEIKKVATASSTAVFVTICLSLLFGNSILAFFGISIASFRIGGGILISMTALSMLNAKTAPSKLNKEELRNVNSSEIGIVPIAIPLLAGPGAISSSVIQANSFTTFFHWVGATLALLVLAIVIRIALGMSRKLSRTLGEVGVNVMTRIMGLILMAIAVEFVAGGIKEIFF